MELANSRFVRLPDTCPVTALIRHFLEQVAAPIRAYHEFMKRERPVTCCSECGGAGYNLAVANRRCSKINSEQRCNGTNAIAKEISDWDECALCQATGYHRNKECPNCKGVGYIFVTRDKVTV